MLLQWPSGHFITKTHSDTICNITQELQHLQCWYSGIWYLDSLLNHNLKPCLVKIAQCIRDTLWKYLITRSFMYHISYPKFHTFGVLKKFTILKIREEIQVQRNVVLCSTLGRNKTLHWKKNVGKKFNIFPCSIIV